MTLLRASELIDANYRDTSGIVVNLSPILRPHNAWSFEFMAYNMRIEPGATHLSMPTGCRRPRSGRSLARIYGMATARSP